MDFYDKETLHFSKCIADVKARTDIDEESKAEMIERYRYEIAAIRQARSWDKVMGIK